MKRSSERRARRWLLEELTRCMDQRVSSPFAGEATSSAAMASSHAVPSDLQNMPA